MPRAVFDTNVLVSGMIFAERSKPLIDEVLEGKITLILSMQMIQEFSRVIARDKFKLSGNQQNTLANFILRIGNVTKIKSRFRVVREDPSDDTILRTAYDGKADYIVSGDEHLLALKEFRGIKIVTVSEMLELLKRTTRRESRHV
jgi:putative PIN family toxin of toxin-antitoxin system